MSFTNYIMPLAIYVPSPVCQRIPSTSGIKALISYPHWSERSPLVLPREVLSVRSQTLAVIKPATLMGMK